MTKNEYNHWPAGVRKSLPVASHTLDDNLREVAKATPEKTALIFYGATKSYAELDDEVTRVAAYLQTICDVQKGDRVGIYMQNSPQFVTAFYGIIRAGGIVVPLNPMHKKDELTYLCQDAGLRKVLTAQDIVANAAALLEIDVLDHVVAAHYGSELPVGRPVNVPDSILSGPTLYPDGVVDWSDMMRADVTFSPVKLLPEDCCTLPYTSGSTGRGKGCKHTHQTALHAVQCIQEWFGYTGNEVHLGAAPMFHIVGMQGVMNVSIATGATIAIMARWDRTAAASIIAQSRVTTWTTVPTAVSDLLNTEGLAKDDLASLRLISGGGSAMPEAVAKRLDDLTGLKFVEVYGMTETMGPVTHNPVDAPKAGCVGIPVMNTKLQLLDQDTLVPVP
uniref:AMP-binding protein n=1 Tax=Planktotalea sp. TaxID=2029877 RepID=UPI003F6CF439